MKFLVLIAVVACLASCKQLVPVVADDLKNNATAYDSKGRQGWQFNQVITYGDYKTSKVKRGWTTSYTFPFVVKFHNAKQRLSFQQFVPNGATAEVFAVSRLETQEFDLIRDIFSVYVKYENTFAGSVVLADEARTRWDFMIYDVDGNMNTNVNGSKTQGFAKRADGESIELRPINAVEGQAKWLDKFSLYGFEFWHMGKPIGAVFSVNNGKVWIRNDIRDDLRPVVASLASSLLLRHSLSSTNNN